MLRTAILLLFGAVLGGCVSSGSQDPLATREGRDAARAAYVQLGLGYLQQGSTGQAKIPLRRALELDGSDADAHAALALVFQRELEPELAERHYRRALAARGEDARILNNYGSFLYEQRRYAEAAERFRQAAADHLYPERSRVYENLGLAALQLNQRAEAHAHFQRSLRLNRNQPRVLLEMAVLAFDDRHYVPARGYYDRFVALGGEQDARSLLLGARLANIFEDRAAAAAYAARLGRLYPGSPEYQQYLSEQQ